MTDINSPTKPHSRAPIQASGQRPEDLVSLVELFFFAYRDFTGEADTALAAYQLGRAHHRVLHFVNRQPGLRVADLLALLKITKQSLARVLKQLVAEGWVAQQPGEDDRRERRLNLTPRGKQLADDLLDLQVNRMLRALSAAGLTSGPVGQANGTPSDAPSDAPVRNFLLEMIASGERAQVQAMINQCGDAFKVGLDGEQG